MVFLPFFCLREAQSDLQGLFLCPLRVSFTHSDSASKKVAQASLRPWVSFLFLRLQAEAWGTPVPLPGVKPVPPALGPWSPSHWTTREVPSNICFLWLYSSLSGPPASLTELLGTLTPFGFLHLIMWFACSSYSRGSQTSLVPEALRQRPTK